MRNKKLIYILIPLVIIIWGAILFRFMDAFYPDENIEFTGTKNITNIPVTNYVADSFSLSLNYPDPFTKSIRRTVVAKPVIKKQPEPIKQVIVSPPNVKYNGTVKNQQTGKEIALVNINNNDYLMQNGKIIDGIELTKIFTDSIRVNYQQYTFTIIKK